MKLGMIGLGKMGYNLVLNLLRHQHEVVAYDVNEQAVKKAADNGAIPASTLEDMVASLQTPRIIWVMVPAGDPLESTITAITPC